MERTELIFPIDFCYLQHPFIEFILSFVFNFVSDGRSNGEGLNNLGESLEVFTNGHQIQSSKLSSAAVSRGVGAERTFPTFTAFLPRSKGHLSQMSPADTQLSKGCIM